jgi:RNA polymerase sigma-70 factor (ECF subfamily)
MDDGDDRALVAAFLASRGEDAFRALYRRHSPAVFGLARKLVDGSDAEDVLQDTWIRAVAALPGFTWSSSLRTWLCGIAVNCCREVWRRREPPAEHAPVAHAPDHGQVLDARSALMRLPPGYRAVVVLHDMYGYTHQEIGALLGIEAGTSKSQLARGREAMRALLNTSGELHHDA